MGKPILLHRIKEHFQTNVSTTLNALERLAEPIANAIERVSAALAQQGKILACGNGGSAADAQHFAAELIGRFEQERPGLPAIALTADTSILTALSNDYGFSNLFSRQIQGLGQSQDILLAISTSGHSENILAAIKQAHKQNMTVIALSGKGGGQLNQLLHATDLHLCVPSQRTAHIQEIHTLIIHCLCDGIDTLRLNHATQHSDLVL